MAEGKFSNRVFDVILIVSACFVLYFWDLGHAPFFDKQEPREALVVWEINHSGNWILPLRNGNEIPAKPPLYHWLAALVSRSADKIDEFTIRCPSALLATAGVLLIYFAGFVLWGRSAGLISAMVLATSFEWLQAAKAARVDMTLTFVMQCALLYFFYLYRNDGGRAKSFILGILLGLATLAKGPLGFVVPCFAYLIFLWVKRDLAFVKKLHPLVLVSTCAMVAGSWYVLALWQGGRDFLTVVIRENFSTVVGQDAGHPHPFFSYIPFFFRNSAPWSIFIIPVAIWLYRSWRQVAQEEMLYLVVWFSTVFVFFSAFTQKRPVYILPLYPAFALIFGAWCQKLTDDKSFAAQFFVKPAMYLNAVAFFLFSALLLFQVATSGFTRFISSGLDPKDQSQLLLLENLLTEHRGVLVVWSTICGFGGMFLVAFSRKSAWRSYVVCSIALMVVSLVFVKRFDTYLAQRYSFKAFTEHMLSTVNNDPLYFYRSADFGVTFYANRHIPIYTKSLRREALPFYLLCWENEWKEIPDTSGLSLDYTSEGVDRQIPERGHLYLVTVHRSKNLKTISVSNHSSNDFSTGF